MTDVIIITYNHSELTLKCLESVYESDITGELNVFVVDNCSVDETVRLISEKFPKVKIIQNEKNLGYAKAVNIGVRSSESEFVIVANNDVIFGKVTISQFIEYLKLDLNAGVLGGQQYFPNGREQVSFGDLPGLKLVLKDLFFINFFQKRFSKNNKIKVVPYLDGACLAIRRSDFEAVGGFDEDYFFYTEEADFCFRLNRAGRKVVFNPSIKFIHLRGAASDESRFGGYNAELLASTRLLFCKKHFSLFERNMYFYLEKMNLNLKFAILKCFSLFSDRFENKFEYFKNMRKWWKK